MSNPDKAAAQVEFPEDEEVVASKEAEAEGEKAVDIETVVNEAVSKMEFDDDGKWKVPEGMTPEMQFAVNTERRRRDTQASFTKTQQALKVAESKTEALTEKLEASIRPSLTVEQREELEDLKETDPEKWRAKLNEYDAEAFGKYEETLVEIDSTANEEVEKVRREELLEQFVKANPDLALNDYVFENDLPPRITGKLKNGEISFEGFLDEVKEYLTKGKAIAKADAGEEEPNLSKAGGTDTASDDDVKKDAASGYETEIF